MPKRNGQSRLRKHSPLYREDEYLPGIHHQAWCPDDSYYRIRDKRGGGGSCIEFTIVSVAADGAPSSPYYGLNIGTVTIDGTSCGLEHLIGDTVEVVDHKGCVFDLSTSELVGVKGEANEKIFRSLASGAGPEDLTPCHWAAVDRCCAPGEA